MRKRVPTPQRPLKLEDVDAFYKTINIFLTAEQTFCYACWTLLNKDCSQTSLIAQLETEFPFRRSSVQASDATYNRVLTYLGDTLQWAEVYHSPADAEFGRGRPRVMYHLKDEARSYPELLRAATNWVFQAEAFWAQERALSGLDPFDLQSVRAFYEKQTILLSAEQTFCYVSWALLNKECSQDSLIDQLNTEFPFRYTSVQASDVNLHRVLLFIDETLQWVESYQSSAGSELGQGNPRVMYRLKDDARSSTELLKAANRWVIQAKAFWAQEEALSGLGQWEGIVLHPEAVDPEPEAGNFPQEIMSAVAIA